MSDFLSLVGSSGLHGLIVGVGVLVTVLLLNKSEVIVTKGQKQFANITLSILLAGVQLLDPALNDVVAASVASLGSALAYEGLRWLLKSKSV
jgi:hypothetical protein